MGRPPKRQSSPPPVSKRKNRLKLTGTPSPALIPHNGTAMPQNSIVDVVPALEWTLRDWIREAGGPTIKQVIAHAASVWPIEREWPEKTVYSWVSRGIPSRDDALRIIAALRLAAQARNRTLFQGLRLFEHSELFLYSRACLEAFRPPSLPELRQMVGSDSIPTAGLNDMRVLDRLSAPPPTHMFGRDLDTVRLLTEIEAHPVVVLTGDTGIGKTALVWSTAQESRSPRYSMIREFDWVTLDPQVQVNDPNWISKTLRHLATRFKWVDVIAMTDDGLIEAFAKKYRSDAVLIVFDQVDDQAQFEALIALLSRLLKGNEPQGRAIVIARQAPTTELRTLQIGPVKQDRMRDFVAYLDALNGHSDRKSDVIVKASAGNPLVAKLLVTYSELVQAEPNAMLSSTINTITDQAAAVQVREVLERIMHKLADNVKWLAVAVARSDRELTDSTLYELWEAHSETGLIAEFEMIKSQLLASSLLLHTIHRREVYAIQPAVREFLLDQR